MVFYPARSTDFRRPLNASLPPSSPSKLILSILPVSIVLHTPHIPHPPPLLKPKHASPFTTSPLSPSRVASAYIMTSDSTNEQSSDNDSRASSKEHGKASDDGSDGVEVPEHVEKKESARDENVTEGREDFDGCESEASPHTAGREGSVVSSHTAGREGSVASSRTVGRSESPASSRTVEGSPVPVMASPSGPHRSECGKLSDENGNEDGSDDTESEDEDSDDEYEGDLSAQSYREGSRRAQYMVYVC